MNSVSPVHVRVENHVKSRMMATNFQDFVEKNRKRVKIAPSTVVQQTRPARISRCATARQQRVSSNANKENIDQSVALKKSRSLSPKPRWCPPPARTTKSAINNAATSTPKMSSQIDLNRLCRLSDYDDLIPVKDRASLSTSAQRAESISPVRSCSVCKPRSPSPLLNAAAAKLSTSTRSIDDAYLSPSMIRHRIGQQQQLRRSPSASPPRRSRSWDEPSSKHSPIKRRQQQRGVGAENAAESSFIAPKREYLVEKLVETDAYANEIACHLAYVKDYLRLEASDLVANAAVVCRQFENDQNRLVDLIDGFQLASEDLKSALYDLSSPDTMSFIRQKQENEFLVKQVDALEMENNNYKKMLFELEKNMNKSGTANEALNVENNVLTNIRMCLEDNRAHLRRQLNAKESEINRLGVQLRELNRKLDRAQIENELLRENRQKAGLAPLKVASSSSTTTMGSRGAARSVSSRPDATAVTRSIKLVKKYYNLEEILADPVKIRLYVEKLNRQLKEKESIIKNLNDVLISKQNVETLHAQRRIDSSSENDALREDNEKLKKLLERKDDKLKTYETNLKLLQKELKPNSDETSTSKNESELEKMRARLQKRLNELEPLPELLKTTELKLHESLSTNAANEATIAEYKRIVDELRAQVDKLKGAKSIKSSADKSDKSAITSARLMEVIDPSKQPQAVNLTINQPPPNANNLDRLMLSVEEENRELLRQLGLKDEQIRDLSGKLSIESNKAASYSRQLDLALNDAKAKEQQLREKFNSNERLLKLKISELEAKLESNDFHSNIDRKDKDNMAHEYLNQIRDLNAKYEQVLATNKQMQEYINFMKNSYMSYFNDQPISSYDIAAATANNNFIGLSQNNIF